MLIVSIIWKEEHCSRRKVWEKIRQVQKKIEQEWIKREKRKEKQVTLPLSIEIITSIDKSQSSWCKIIQQRKYQSLQDSHLICRGCLQVEQKKFVYVLAFAENFRFGIK